MTRARAARMSVQRHPESLQQLRHRSACHHGANAMRSSPGTLRAPVDSASLWAQSLCDQSLLENLAEIRCQAAIVAGEHLVKALFGLVGCFPRLLLASRGFCLVLLN